MTSPHFSTPTTRWTALTTRNPLAANSFIYSVLTTKIYCRPTCPSRLARRANIIFHDSPAAAEADGFRACMRCKPGTLSGEEGDPQRIAVERAKEILRGERDGAEGEEGKEGKWSVKMLAKEVGMTESHFCRVFKKIEGVTVGEFRARVRKNMPVGQDGTTDQPFVASGKSAFAFEGQPRTATDSFPAIFDDTNLAQDWQDFSGPSHAETALDLFPGIFDVVSHFDINFGNMGDITPDLLSDPSSPGISDDGLHFLNFDLHNSPE